MAKEAYDRLADHYDTSIRFAERKWFSSWRKKYLSRLKGEVLEIGIGTGQSIRYYNQSAHVIGIDSSSHMLKIAKKRLLDSGRCNVCIRKMNSDNLRFPDRKFDHVVTFLIFCSVSKPEKTISEIKRVLKPDGTGIFVEHVLSSNKLGAISQRLMNPATKFLISDDITRDTRQDLINSGFKIIKEENLLLGDVFRMFAVKKVKR